MLQKLRAKLNGNIEKVVEVLIIGGIIFWMFCQVRDLPATYVTKADSATEHAKLETALGNMDKKITDIHTFLMGNRK